MMQDYLPMVLQSKIQGNSISMERALKQILLFLERAHTNNDTEEQAIINSIEDIEFMISKIK